MANLPSQDFKKKLRDFRHHLQGWDGDYHINSTQATLFALWEIEFHVNILSDQIPQRVLRETMVNIPDSDLFLMDLLEHLFNDPSYLSKYCQSNVTIYDKSYTYTENKCLLSLAYNAVYSWKILENTISKDTKDWGWGKVHIQFYEHLPFSQIPVFKQIFHREVGIPGSRRTLSFGCYDSYSGDMEKNVFFKSLFSANFRGVIDMATYEDPDKYPMYMSIDTGASQHFYSKHYFDMNAIHYSKEGRIMEVGLEKAKENARYHLELKPRE